MVLSIYKLVGGKIKMEEFVSEFVNAGKRAELYVYDDFIDLYEFDEYDEVYTDKKYEELEPMVYKMKKGPTAGCCCTCMKCKTIMIVTDKGFKCTECKREVTDEWLGEKINEYFENHPIEFEKTYADIYE